MCGRFSFSTSPQKIQEQFGDIRTGENLKINFNVAPTQHSYLITNEHPEQLSYFRWGLVPHWAKDTKSAARLINARMEGIASKPSFRVAIRKRRCLVLADSFYEWKKDGSRKVPFRILPRKEELLVLAGIWEVWYQDEDPLHTFSIITSPPNKEVAPVHNRMPLVLHKKAQWKKWLSDLHIDEVLDMLQPPPDGILKNTRYPSKSIRLEITARSCIWKWAGRVACFDYNLMIIFAAEGISFAVYNRIV